MCAGICEQVAEVAISTGVCIDLYHNGLDNRVLCGANVADFCNKWNDLRVRKGIYTHSMALGCLGLTYVLMFFANSDVWMYVPLYRTCW